MNIATRLYSNYYSWDSLESRPAGRVDGGGGVPLWNGHLRQGPEALLWLSEYYYTFVEHYYTFAEHYYTFAEYDFTSAEYYCTSTALLLVQESRPAGGVDGGGGVPLANGHLRQGPDASFWLHYYYTFAAYYYTFAAHFLVFVQ